MMPRCVQVPGNIRRAEHFVQFLRRLLEYLRRRMGTQAVEQETPATFLGKLQEAMSIDGVPACTGPMPQSWQAPCIPVAASAGPLEMLIVHPEAEYY